MSSDYAEGPVNTENEGEFRIQQLAEIVNELVSEITGQP